jgi:ABC-2 type transport system permease protein
MFRVEIGKAIHRPRTYVFGVGLAALAILPVVVLATGDSGGGGPVFFGLIRHNGLFAALTVIGLIQPFFLPLGTSLLSGEAIAGEASSGTLRYLVARPVGRGRLVLTKYASVVAEVGAAIAWVIVVGLVAGGLAFGYGALATLSGTTLGPVTAVVRIAATAGYALWGMAALAAVGVFVSVLTSSGVGAAIGTMAIAIASQILDSLPSLHVIHPYLLSHEWFAFIDLFRSPIEWGHILHGLVVGGVYLGMFLGLALAVFSRKDILS